MKYLCLLLAVGFSVPAIAQDTLPKGIVKEKPGEGFFVETDKGFMVPYTETIPGTDLQFEMVPIPGGTFHIGSSDDEEERGDRHSGQEAGLYTPSTTRAEFHSVPRVGGRSPRGAGRWATTWVGSRSASNRRAANSTDVARGDSTPYLDGLPEQRNGHSTESEP